MVWVAEPLPHVGELDLVQPSPVTAVADRWGVNQWMGTRCVAFKLKESLPMFSKNSADDLGPPSRQASRKGLTGLVVGLPRVLPKAPWCWVLSGGPQVITMGLLECPPNVIAGFPLRDCPREAAMSWWLNLGSLML